MPDSPRQTPPSFYEVMKSRSTGVIGLSSDVLGAFGYIGIVRYVVDNNAPAGAFGLSAGWLTAVVSAALIVPLLLWTFWGILRTWINRQSESLDDHRRALDERNEELFLLRKQLGEVKAASRHDMDRFEQRHAIEHMAYVYGYVVKKRRHAYTVFGSEKDNGIATCFSEVWFLCNRRALGNWSRLVKSTIGNELVTDKKPRVVSGQSIEVTPEIRRETTPSGTRLAVQKLTFTPTLEHEHGVVKLNFKDELDPTFLRHVDRARGRTTDWIQAQTVEPVELLELEAAFHDYTPTNIRAEAFYGSGSQPLPMEQFEVHSKLKEDSGKGIQSAKLTVDYPVMGVTYRLIWDLPPEPLIPPAVTSPGPPSPLTVPPVASESPADPTP